MEHFHLVVFGILTFTVLFSFVLQLYEGGISGYAIKTLHKPDLVAPADWKERRYVCDLPNRDDCIHCCDEVRKFSKGPATLIDFESCIVKMPKQKVEGAAHTWEDCIRVVSGLKPKYSVIEPVEKIIPQIEELPSQVSLPLSLSPVQEQPRQLPSPLLQEQQAPAQLQPPARELGTIAPYKICSLLRKKPERPLVFMPFHPLMIASVIC